MEYEYESYIKMLKPDGLYMMYSHNPDYSDCEYFLVYVMNTPNVENNKYLVYYAFVGAAYNLCDKQLSHDNVKKVSSLKEYYTKWKNGSKTQAFIHRIHYIDEATLNDNITTEITTLYKKFTEKPNRTTDETKILGNYNRLIFKTRQDKQKKTPEE